jgi:hypothetical protein
MSEEMKCFSKSPWMTAAALGAGVSFLTLHARTSLALAVK